MTYARRAACATLVAVLLAVAVGAALWQQGYRVYAVKTGSMSPTIPTGSLVVDAPADRHQPNPGDVVTFRTETGLVTHRLLEWSALGLTTKGDANHAPDPWTITPEQVVGTVRAGIAGGGYVLVFLQQPTGVPSLVVLALSIAFAWSLFFPAAPDDRQGRGSRHGGRERARTPLPSTPVVAGLVMVTALAAGGAGSRAASEPTGAYFTDSVVGSISLSVDCADRHEHGNGPEQGAGHAKCRGNGHAGGSTTG